MERPALIVVDMLNDFFQEWEPEPRQELVQSINELTDLMRSVDHTVIWVRQEFSPDLSDAFPEMREHGIKMTIKGTPGSQLLPELTVSPADLKVVKKRYSAFFGTDLDFELARTQPDSVIVAGINTHACVRMTAIDAYQRDWKVVLAGDCVASYDREHHDISLKYMDGKIAQVMSNEQIRDALALVSSRRTGTD
jgi:nicotinamidase-related amidase